MIGGDEKEGGRRGREVLARRDRRHVRHDAGERRPDNRVGELTRRLVTLRQGVEVARILLDTAVGIAVEIGGDRGELLIEGGDLLLGGLQVPAPCRRSIATRRASSRGPADGGTRC